MKELEQWKEMGNIIDNCVVGQYFNGLLLDHDVENTLRGLKLLVGISIVSCIATFFCVTLLLISPGLTSSGIAFLFLGTGVFGIISVLCVLSLIRELVWNVMYGIGLARLHYHYSTFVALSNLQESFNDYVQNYLNENR